MKTVIVNLIEAVKAKPTAETIQSLYPTLSPKKASAILSDIQEHLNGNLQLEELGMYLMNDGIGVPQ